MLLVQELVHLPVLLQYFGIRVQLNQLHKRAQIKQQYINLQRLVTLEVGSHVVFSNKIKIYLLQSHKNTSISMSLISLNISNMFNGVNDMGKIIKLPQKPVREPTTEPNNRLLLNEWSFTCPNCDTSAHFSAEHIIFRRLEFYCKSCGQLHRVSNPAFVFQPKK
jgi:hypothetical protein